LSVGSAGHHCGGYCMAANWDFTEVRIIQAIGSTVKINRKVRKNRPAQRHQSMGFLTTGRVRWRAMSVMGGLLGMSPTISDSAGQLHAAGGTKRQRGPAEPPSPLRGGNEGGGARAPIPWLNHPHP